MRRHMGYWSLTAVAFGGIIGSGWLLSPMHAAVSAGPASLITWVVGGIALMLIALVMVEMGATMPEAGGLVRWPLHTSGRLVATLVGWGIWVAYATNPPSESAAMLQYMSKYVPGLFSGGRLTVLGVVCGLAFMAVFVAINWFGVKLFAHVNLAVTIAKFAVPAVTVCALIASGFHKHNFTGHGGFAPYGYAAPLSAIATAGVIYAYTGFQGPIDLAAEAKDPKRDIPRAVMTALGLSMVVYLALQLAFVGAIPGSDLLHGWQGIDLNSPFAQLAASLNLTWLTWLLYGDAIASPGGSAMVFTAETSREVYALGKNRLLPESVAVVHPGSGVPRRALLVNFVVGAAFLLPFGNWQSIVAATSILGLFAYSLSVVAEASVRKADPDRMANWVKGTRIIAPVSFVIATLIFYWAGWHEVRVALPVLFVSVLLYAYQQIRHDQDLRDLRNGLWLVVYLLLLMAMSGIGTFGGAKWIAAPWDSVVVAVIGAVAYVRGTRDAARHIATHPLPPPVDLEAEARESDDPGTPEPSGAR
ncbi:APC family permease [Streptomyces sp. SL13]|uniref:APC family permease n=1 Tax=Streptantibioticus silvisoli TaxID=2705255 RepID=A0AA90HAA7_9ACTN|nr:APC family permease [Streptantibioticus silvisoli]MDI5967408.1 APC family permease [Streptantibioticus silvisoli]MDI5974125.1 APC family permease [Streptantibioticus silvisoli]